MGGSGQTIMPAHMSSSQNMQSHAVQKSQSTSNNRNGADQTSFSAVLRNLAKQQTDIKDDDMGQSVQQQSSDGKSVNVRANEKEIDMSRQGSSSRNLSYDARGHTTIRHMPSPEPPEKKVNCLKISKIHLMIEITFF